MKRFLIITEGENKGFTKILDVPLLTVGRSTDADFKIDDPKVSRMHLEIRVEAEGVFVKNRSVKGSTLNGSALSAEVSLNPGDDLGIGNTHLRYDEGEVPAPVPEAPGASARRAGKLSAAEPAGGMDDRTRAAPADLGREFGKKSGFDDDESEGAGKTKVFEEGGTRVASEEELKVDPRKLEKQRQGSSSVLKFILLLFLLGGAIAGAYWFLRQDNQGPVGSTEFKDPGGVYSITHPDDWVKNFDKPDVTVLVHGSEGTREWARVNIYRERTPALELTGLTDSFTLYEDTLRQRFKDYKDFKLMSKVVEVNNATAILFKLEGANLEGKGLYVLNGPTRVVVECYSKPAAYAEQFSTLFGSLLSSFRLLADGPQQYIEYPLPTAALRQMALAKPAELERELNRHMETGKALLAEKDVKLDNLFKSIQEYRLAMQLAIAGPKRLPAGDEAAKGLVSATKLFNKVLQDQRFEILLAKKEGDVAKVRWHAQKIMQMVPDKADVAYIEAANLMREFQRRNGESQ